MIIAVFSWILFNALTSLITKEYDFFDNYYALIFFILISLFKSSYKLQIKNNNLTVKRNGMVTVNIDISGIKNYKLTGKTVDLHTIDNGIFCIKTNKLSNNQHQHFVKLMNKLTKKGPFRKPKIIKFSEEKVPTYESGAAAIDALYSRPIYKFYYFIQQTIAAITLLLIIFIIVVN